MHCRHGLESLLEELSEALLALGDIRIVLDIVVPHVLIQHTQIMVDEHRIRKSADYFLISLSGFDPFPS